MVALSSCGGDRSIETKDVLPVPPDTTDKPYEQFVRVYDALFLEDFRKTATPSAIVFTSVEDIESLQILLKKGSIEPSDDLKEDGFTESIDELVLASMPTDRTTDKLVHLHISKAGIHDSNGVVLIDQIEATYGYGWRLGKTNGSDLIPARSYLVIIMLDENGGANSDELFIYRNYESGNLGEFVVSNLPDELI